MNWTALTFNRGKAARWTFGFAFVIFVYRLLTHSLVHQMERPVLSEISFDYTYWLFHLSGIPALLTGNKANAWLFDILLLCSTLYCWSTAGARRWAVLVCAICWTFYGLIYNSYSCHHNSAVIGIMVLPYAFLAQKEKTFRLVWDGMRYFCLYLYADAFIHKAMPGHGLYFFPNGAEFIKTNQSSFMLQHPHSVFTSLYTFLITHPALAYIGFVGMVGLQGCMILGFFSKRWDRWLFWIPIIFHTVNLLFIDVFFYELLILNLTLIPLEKEKAAGSPAEKVTEHLVVGLAD